MHLTWKCRTATILTHASCLVLTSVLTPWTNLAGTSNENAKRADIVYFRSGNGGGQVFSVGSITFCGSLPYNNFDNNISRMVKNVLDRFMEENVWLGNDCGG